MKIIFPKIIIVVILCFLFFSDFLVAQISSLPITPSPLYAGQIPISSSENVPFRITNFFSNSVEIQSITILQQGSEYTIINDPTPFTLFPFSELKLEVQYTPSVPGKDAALVQIQTSVGVINDSITGYGISIVGNIPTFERLIGFQDDLEVNTAEEAPDGGYVLTGTIQLLEHVNQDAYVLKTDRYGKKLWNRSFEAGTSGGSNDGGDDQGMDAVALDDGSIIVMCNSDSWGPGDFSIILSKWDQDGNFLWETAYGGTFNDKGNRMIIDSEGFIIVVGSTNNTADQTENAFVLKINPSDGALIWKNDFGESGGIQSGYDIVEYGDGGYIFVGNNQLSSAANLYFAKINKDGILEWSKSFTSNIISEADRIIRVSQGGFIASGYTLTNDKGKEGYLVKVDAEANMEWSKSFGTNHPDDFKGVIQSSDGGFLCVGTINQVFSIEQSIDDLWLLKTDFNGNIIWEKRFGGELNDSGTDIIKTTEGGFAVLGSTSSFTSDEDRVYFLHLNENGSITNVKEIDKILSHNFVLYQNYPNPFNPSTLIQFEVAGYGSEHISLIVYDVLGREITTLVNDILSNGYYQVEFNVLNVLGKSLSSGIYFYKLISGNNILTKKMLLLK
jgi:hypothetical protein